jgi:hypothetical protein
MLGFQPGELFDTTDLYEDKDMMRVRTVAFFLFLFNVRAFPASPTE